MDFEYKGRFELLDETLREGAERAIFRPSLGEKIEIARAIADIGINSLVVGMFPDVPENIELLDELLASQLTGFLPSTQQFYVVSHVGITFFQTLNALKSLKKPLNNVWIILIHSVSDKQILHLFPTVLKKDSNMVWDDKAWYAKTDVDRRYFNLSWLDTFLTEITQYEGGGIMMGLLDTFRANVSHIDNTIEVCASHGIKKIRLVDTAGTATQETVNQLMNLLKSKYAHLDFYGHFHNDFGLATANAILGLKLGMKGIDVSVGGFANRAGHPPIAEIALALKKLYGIDISIKNTNLFQLSRKIEKAYGLMENPTQPITGPITFGVLSGIRTELLNKCPDIFDAINPSEVGANIEKMFGSRSGKDGVLRVLKANETKFKNRLEINDTVIDTIYAGLSSIWSKRSDKGRVDIEEIIKRYHHLLKSSVLSEVEVVDWIENNYLAKVEQSKIINNQEQESILGKTEITHLCQFILGENDDFNVINLINKINSILNSDIVQIGNDLGLQRILYTINVANHLTPWEYPNLHVNMPEVMAMKYKLELYWQKAYESELDFNFILTDEMEFLEYVKKFVYDHKANLSHELFYFIEHDASFSQLKEFIRQETPFDIYFGDLLAKLMIGVYGNPKEEICKNYWDEVGHGAHEKMHRTLRLDMMKTLGISHDDHIVNYESYLLSELRLANMYFEAVYDRSKLLQMIGMMTATELVVSGRLQKQINGWKRVGLNDQSLQYLIEHTIVDPIHASGWIENVVLPLLAKYPESKRSLFTGIYRRMKESLNVCDEMLTHLKQLN